jgi:hypothetical protein
MNPYLEQPELWSAVHSRLIVAIADNLVDHLSEQYRVEVEILVRRSRQRPSGDLYAFGLRDQIPPVPIPLLPDELEPILELQKLLNYVYDRGRYHLAIDYTQPPQPELSESDRLWAEELLNFRSIE